MITMCIPVKTVVNDEYFLLNTTEFLKRTLSHLSQLDVVFFIFPFIFFFYFNGAWVRGCVGVICENRGQRST